MVEWKFSWRQHFIDQVFQPVPAWYLPVDEMVFPYPGCSFRPGAVYGFAGNEFLSFSFENILEDVISGLDGKILRRNHIHIIILPGYFFKTIDSCLDRAIARPVNGGPVTNREDRRPFEKIKEGTVIGFFINMNIKF